MTTSIHKGNQINTKFSNYPAIYRHCKCL